MCRAIGTDQVLEVRNARHVALRCRRHTGHSTFGNNDLAMAAGIATSHDRPAMRSQPRETPGHHGYPRTSDLIRVEALEGRMCHQITDAAVRPFLHLLNPTRRPRRN